VNLGKCGEQNALKNSATAEAIPMRMAVFFAVLPGVFRKTH
jgi:hypothetical protein